MNFVVIAPPPYNRREVPIQIGQWCNVDASHAV